MKCTGASTLDTCMKDDTNVVVSIVVNGGVETIDETVPNHGMAVVSSASEGNDSTAAWNIDTGGETIQLSSPSLENNLVLEEFDVQNALDSEEEVFDFLAEALEGECFDPNLVV